MQPEFHSILKIIRVHKKDSAFVYSVFESHEGILNHSTCDSEIKSPYRDLILRISPSYIQEAQQLLEQIKELVFPVS